MLGSRGVAYIAVIHISGAVEAKLATKHNVTAAEVREACVLTRLERAVWHEGDRARRLLATGTTGDGRRLNVVLYPADERDGTWWLGTAMWA